MGSPSVTSALGLREQERLFAVPLDESKLGPNQQDVLSWIDRWGWVSVRAAGRIVYRNRGYRDPDRIPEDRVESAGWRVLLSLKRRGLIVSRRQHRWCRKAAA
jgi:hypothetical protein